MQQSNLTLFRLLSIDQRLRQNPAPTLREIVRYCSTIFDEIDQGDKVSQGQIKADLEIFKKGYGAPIDLKKTGNTYSYTKPEFCLLSLNSNQAQYLFHVLKLSFLSQTNKREVLKFESLPVNESWDYLPALLKAIPTGKWIEVDYQSVQSNKVEGYKLAPFGLKQLRGAWYLVAIKEGEKVSRLFNLARLKGEVKICRGLHSISYSHSIMPKVDVEPVKVTIEVERSLLKKLNNSPIHFSQTVTKSDNRTATIQLMAEITPELVGIILSLGNQARVVTPESLVKQVYESSIGIIENYTKHFSKK